MMLDKKLTGKWRLSKRWFGGLKIVCEKEYSYTDDTQGESWLEWEDANEQDIAILQCLNIWEA